MRLRLLVLFFALVLAATGCDSSQRTGWHFTRSSGNQTVVYLVNGHYNPYLDDAFAYAAMTWSWNPRLEVRHVRSCPALRNCVHVQLEDLPYYLGFGGITGAIEPYHAHTGTITIDWPWPAGQNLRHTACHEVGHALGLAHGISYQGNGYDGPCDYWRNIPTDLDQRNIEAEYGHRDAVGPPGV